MDALTELAHIGFGGFPLTTSISVPNRLVDLLTFYYGDYTIKTTTNISIKPLSTVHYMIYEGKNNCECVPRSGGVHFAGHPQIIQTLVLLPVTFETL
jgi:hypothetical protein